MKTLKHTPAPWLADEVDYMVYDANNLRVADCSCDGQDMTDNAIEANVRLIAAAPKLLKTLKAVMACMQKKTPWDDAKVILTEAHKVIREAEGNL